MKIAFNKSPDGLVPAIVQDVTTKTVLMLGYMNAEAVQKTQETAKVTFYSRSKQRLWTKGEESGNYLNFHSMEVDCDQDSLLIQATPQGPTCHKGSDSCWNATNQMEYGFLTTLEKTIRERKEAGAADQSYVASLFEKGINKIAQKVGEEAIETVIEAKDDNTALFLNESADLLFHYLILLHAKGQSLDEVVNILKERKK